MLDAFMPEDGQALADLQPPAAREAFLPAERSGADNFAAAARRHYFKSTKTTAPGSMHNARRSRSSAFCSRWR